GAAAVAPKRRRKRDAAAAAAGEEVHGGEQKRQKRGDQCELDRPARQDPGAEVHVASRSRRELDGGIEPAQELLDCAPELAEPARVEPADLVEERGRRALAAGGQGQRRESVLEQRPLLVKREGEREVDQLRESARARGSPSGLLEHTCGGGLDDPR